MGKKITLGTKKDGGKSRAELVPPSLILSVADILTFGAIKYEDRNWEQGIAYSRVYGSLMRHLLAWWGGQDLDEETGKSHLHHAACNIAFLIEFEATHRDLDDRPFVFRKKYLKKLKKLKGKKKKLKDKKKKNRELNQECGKK